MIKDFHNFENSFVSEKYKTSDMNDVCCNKNTQIVNINCKITLDKSIRKIKNNHNNREQLLIDIIKCNVLPVNSLLDDFSLDKFLNIVRNTDELNPYSTLYISRPERLTSIYEEKDVHIVGDLSGNHWHFSYYDRNILHIYSIDYILTFALIQI